MAELVGGARYNPAHMQPNWAEIMSATTALAALLIATAAWWIGVRQHRSSIRPLLRPYRRPGYGNSGLVLKNVGNGPALSVVVFDTRKNQICVEVDAVELPGGTVDPELLQQDRERWDGSVPVHVHPPMYDGAKYLLLYQDLEGSWHETAFVVGVSEWDDHTSVRVSAKHRGRCGWLRAMWLPREVTSIGIVSRRGPHYPPPG